MAQLPPAGRQNRNAPPRTPTGSGGESVRVSLPKERATAENILLAVFAHYGLRSGAEVERALDSPGYWQKAIREIEAGSTPAQVARLPRGGRYEARWGVPEDIVRDLRAYREQARSAPASQPRVVPALPLPPLDVPMFDPMLSPPGVHPNAPAGANGPGRFGSPQPAGMGDGATSGELDPRGVLNELWDGITDTYDSLQCVREAIERANIYAPQAILDETGHALHDLVAGLIPGLLLAGATLGGTTALGAGIGAVVGAFGGGVGAVPGAAAGASLGAEIGLAILTWMGLGMLVVYVGSKLGQVGEAVGSGVAQAWSAGGEPPQIREREVDAAAREMARGTGVLFRLILEGIVAYVIAKGMGAATSALSKTKLGVRFAAWVEANWTSLRSNPRLNRNNRGGGRPGDETAAAPPPAQQPPPQKPSPALATNLPKINPQKQAGHVKGTPQYNNRVKAGKPTSYFDDKATADQLVQEAYAKGIPVPNRPEIREYDFGRTIGTGPQGQAATKVRVHVDAKGEIHGYPKP